MAIGETSALEGGDKSKMEDLATRVRDLNARLNDIRREQVFQRVSLQFLLKKNRATETNTDCVANETGTRGRVPRPVREHQRSRGALDPDPADRAGRDVCLAAVAPAVLLYQAEAYIAN